MNFLASDIVRSAAIYPHSLDGAARRVLLVPLSEADYRAASFLDTRVLTPGMRMSWVPFDQLAAAARDVKPLPLHFIFHAGHVGSTLLSRLLDELPGVLGLREPSVLRQLAGTHDAADTDIRVETFLPLWSRGFAGTRAVVIKATSVVGQIAPMLMAASPESRGVYLNLSAGSYITAVLAASGGMEDLNAFADARAMRLTALLGETPQKPEGPGELAALAWLVERLAQAAAQKSAGARVLDIDFESLLADLEQTMMRIAAHFRLDASPASIAALASSPVLTRYSKAPHRLGFSPAHRAAMMQKARDIHAAEIRKGLALLARLQKNYPLPF